MGWASIAAKYARKTIHLANGGKVILHWEKVGNVVTFGNRNDLRKVLELSTGMPNRAHHIIPWAIQTDDIVQAAAKAKKPISYE